MWNIFNLLLLTLLATTSLCYQNYQFTSYGALQLPQFSLGALTAGDVITFNIRFPVDTTVTPRQYSFYLLKPGFQAVTPNPPGFNTVHQIPAGLTASHTWTVASSDTYTVLTSFNPVDGKSAIQIY